MTKPNLFIIGAPKCGTTALAEYLRAHPDIFISNPKEPHFFNTDSPYKQTYRDSKEYKKLFENTQIYSLRGEASVFYFFSKVAITNILEYNPQAKFIVMIRNPLQMAPSLHQQYFFSGKENEVDFNKAWSLEEIRKQGENLPKTVKLIDREHLQYSNICTLGTQLERAMNQIPKEQLHVIVFDDFVQDTRTEYREVLKFLGIKDDGRVDFPKVNPATSVRSSFAHKLLNNIPRPIYQIAFTIKRLLGVKRLNIDNKVRAINTKVEKFQDVTPETYTEMQEVFTPEIQKLERLLDRDFSHWLNPEKVKDTAR